MASTKNKYILAKDDRTTARGNATMSSKLPTILVVERNRGILQEIKANLEKHAWTVRTAVDANQAIGVLKSERIDVALVELDIEAGKNIGLEVVSGIRQSRLSKNISIFVMNSERISGAILEQIMAKANIIHAFAKPLDIGQIGETIKLKLKTSKTTEARPPVTYDVKIINCFINAVGQVTEFYFAKAPQLQKASIKKDRQSFGFVTGLIGFQGAKLVGSMSITSNLDFLQSLAKKVFEGDNPPLTEELMADLMGEMCNQVCGKVKMNFAKLGVAVAIGLPKVVLGKDHYVIHMASSPVLSVPVDIDGKKCVMEFCLTDVVGDFEPEPEKAIAQQETNVIWED